MWGRPHTENQPRLTELQIDAEVGLDADVRDGDVCVPIPTQALVLPEAMPDAWETDRTLSNRLVCCGWNVQRIVGCCTVADSSDDPEDEEPEEHVSSVAQQQDEEQADRHGDDQSPAATPTSEDLTQSDTRKQIYEL